MVTFTLEECTRAAEIEAMADVPKGKPSPEQKAKMDEQKKARLEFTAGLKEKYTLEEEVKVIKAVPLVRTHVHALQRAPWQSQWLCQLFTGAAASRAAEGARWPPSGRSNHPHAGQRLLGAWQE